MSNIGNWAYVNKAIVRPFTGQDEFTGTATYGPEYTIQCYYTSSTELVKDSDGKEIVASMEFFTETDTVKVNDLVNGKRVFAVHIINASPFGEANDYRIFV